MVLTTVLLDESTVALPVETGTTSPTCRVAVWLLITTNDGLDNTLTLVTVCRASRMTFGDASDPTRKLNPGRTRLMAADVAAVATVEAADWVLMTEPSVLLLRKNCTP